MSQKGQITVITLPDTVVQWLYKGYTKVTQKVYIKQHKSRTLTACNLPKKSSGKVAHELRFFTMFLSVLLRQL